MINHYEFLCKNGERHFWDVDVPTARKLFVDYNIYFRYYNPRIDTHIQEFDYFILDSLKDFNEQFNHIKTLCFPDFAKIFFSTDYKTNNTILKRKILEAKEILNKKNKTFSVSNISEIIKIKRDVIRPLIWELQNEKQSFMKFED